MRDQKPPFEIPNQMIDYMAEIAELVEKISAVLSIRLCVATTESERFMVLWSSSRTLFL